jgi:predicted homoserine dehydrogenase-like protein
MVTKEADCVVGPILQAKAAAAGRLCTPVDGDQPSLAIALVAWARTLGLEVVCAGKSGEYDLVYSAAGATLAAGGATRPAAELAALWTVPPARLAATVAARAEALADVTRATVPDLCELTIIANATGLAPDRPALHAPIARTLELPELFRPRTAGGLLERAGAVDMFVGLRRDDEPSFAGGVFVVVRCDDPAAWRVLRAKGIPTSDDLGCALLHNPVHLLGVEAPASILAAVLSGLPAATLQPAHDLVARATRALRAGERLAIGARHTIPGVEALIVPAQPAGAAAPLPYYMLAGCTLRAPVHAGAILTRAMVEPPADSTLWALRAEQDRRFFGGATAAR